MCKNEQERCCWSSLIFHQSPFHRGFSMSSISYPESSGFLVSGVKSLKTLGTRLLFHRMLWRLARSEKRIENEHSSQLKISYCPHASYSYAICSILFCREESFLYILSKLCSQLDPPLNPVQCYNTLSLISLCLKNTLIMVISWSAIMWKD